ncbi:PREDICTED: uncharacterized protein LOC108358497 [Rhagoletis zephyria]|uniref:uncharacterized protein LOC108358497 n=1 Tax=Rhagoletis zephyria TaxID=28612 RepID=UPI0008112D64|nr:PREDICTED: uncharacterized protein LOC108358497 [Rhagoletis zephyria]
MNKHLFKKYGAQNPSTSAAAIPIKKAKYTTENKMLLQNSSRRVSLTSECTIESRRISVSTSAIEANGDTAKMPFKELTPEDTVRSALKFEKAKYFKKAYRQKKKNVEN